MRSTLGLRAVRPVHVAAGALTLAIPSSAVALAAGQADAQGAISIDVSRPHVGYGDHLTVTGTAPTTDAGHALELQFERKSDPRWRTVSTATVANDGRFRFVAAMRQSGLVRAVPSSGGSSTRAVPAGVTSNTSPSAPQPVSVASQFHVNPQPVAVGGGGSGDVGGKLLPGVAGRSVALEGRSGGHWHVLARSRTRAGGQFDVHLHTARGAQSGEPLRVRFQGDRLNTGASAPAGRVTVFHPSLASWYSDGGGTACGFHAHFGVANKSLPCGTKVTFHYGGRTVTAVVDDRGPYVGGREWDLNQNTAGALGFGGVGVVWAAW
jgi:rare lipoprotein A